MILKGKQKELFIDLEKVRGEYETVLDDSSVKSLPRALERINDKFDEILQKLEDGEFQEEVGVGEEEEAG